MLSVDNIILIILIVALAILTFIIVGGFIFLINRDFEEIQETLYNKYVKFDPSVDDVSRLAVEVWKLKNNVKKIENLSEADKNFLKTRVRQFEKYLDKNKVEIDDYTGRKFSDGMKVNVVNFEYDEKVSHPMIKETVQPAIKYKGMIQKEAQVIVATNKRKEHKK